MWLRPIRRYKRKQEHYTESSTSHREGVRCYQNALHARSFNLAAFIVIDSTRVWSCCSYVTRSHFSAAFRRVPLPRAALRQADAGFSDFPRESPRQCALARALETVFIREMSTLSSVLLMNPRSRRRQNSIGNDETVRCGRHDSLRVDGRHAKFYCTKVCLATSHFGIDAGATNAERINQSQFCSGVRDAWEMFQDDWNIFFCIILKFNLILINRNLQCTL